MNLATCLIVLVGTVVVLPCCQRSGQGSSPGGSSQGASAAQADKTLLFWNQMSEIADELTNSRRYEQIVSNDQKLSNSKTNEEALLAAVKKITELPTSGVDPEVIEYATQRTSFLKECSTLWAEGYAITEYFVTSTHEIRSGEFSHETITGSGFSVNHGARRALQEEVIARENVLEEKQLSIGQKATALDELQEKLRSIVLKRWNAEITQIIW